MKRRKGSKRRSYRRNSARRHVIRSLKRYGKRRISKNPSGRKIITFENGLDYRTRTVGKPTVARMRLHNRSDSPYVYVVIGTPYGHVHTTGGDVRVWKSYSGANDYIRKNYK